MPLISKKILLISSLLFFLFTLHYISQILLIINLIFPFLLYFFKRKIACVSNRG